MVIVPHVIRTKSVRIMSECILELILTVKENSRKKLLNSIKVLSELDFIDKSKIKVKGTPGYSGNR